MRLLVLLPLMALCACVAPTMPLTKSSTLKTVGIVSSVGDQVTLKDLGLLVDTYQIGPTTDWGIDEFVVKTAAEELGRRYTVKPVVYDIRAFHSAPGAYQSINPLIPALKAALVGAAGKDGITDSLTDPPDAYVVITKERAAGTVSPILGVGLMHDIFGMTTAFAIYEVWFVDGHDFTVIGHASGQLPDWTPFDVPKGPHERVDSSMWASKFDALSVSQRQQIIAEIEHLIAASFPIALQRMNVGN